MSQHSKLVTAFGKVIKRQRRLRGWSQHDLAERLGHETRYPVQYMERVGRHNRHVKKEATITLRAIVQMAAAFEMSVLEFMTAVDGEVT